MAVASIERRLAAILAADVVGYSRLMGQDEAGTLERLKAHRRELIDPAIERHHGRIVKLMGDGALVEFPSVVDAVACAVEIQDDMAERNSAAPEAERIEFRVGITLGDVIVEPDDIYGDGVNVAARLEALAEPGGICVSRLVQESVRGKLDVAFDDLGEQRLKNIAEPVRAYRVRIGPGAAGAAGSSRLRHPRWLAALAGGAIMLIVIGAGGWRFYLQPMLQERAFAEQTALPLPDKPSIAVLPFANMSGDPEQDYFSDGITDSLITDLSMLSGLFVIARNSVFTYKGRAVKVRDVGRELGVRYVLEGSVQKAGERIRINAQLIDAATGYHVWADRFDRQLEDVFALQDEVTSSIVAALEVRLTDNERETLAQRYSDDLDAYDLFLRGQEQYWRYSEEGRLAARSLFERAIEIDPGFARAYASLAMTYTGQTGGISEASLDRAHDLAQKAISLDETLREVHWSIGYVHRQRKEHAAAIESLEKALDLDPNYADAYGLLSTILSFTGRPEQGLETLEKAKRLNPAFAVGYYQAEAFAYFAMGRYAAAIATLAKALARNPADVLSRVYLAATYANAGQLADAEWEVAELLTLDSDLSIEVVREWAPFTTPQPLEHLLDGLRQAGLPEETATRGD